MELKLKTVSRETAEYACKNWHYSKRLPAGRLLIFGVWESDEFVGVIIYGKGANSSMCKYFNMLHTEICELVRIALKPHKIPVSKMISISIKLLKKLLPNMKLIFSYADKDEGHKGTIYKTSNFSLINEDAGIGRGYIVNGVKTHTRSLSSILNKRNISVTLDNIKKYLDPQAKMYQTSGKYLYTYSLI